MPKVYNHDCDKNMGTTQCRCDDCGHSVVLAWCNNLACSSNMVCESGRGAFIDFVEGR